MPDQKKPNFKAPYSPHHDQSGSPQELFADHYYEYEVCHCGTHHTKYRDPSGQSNFNSRVGPSGDWDHHDNNNNDPVSTEVYPSAHRHYTNNHSTHADANREKYSGGNYNKNTDGQHSKTTSKDDLGGATKDKIALHGNEARIRSKSNHVNTSDNGIHIQTTGGESYNYHAGNVATTYGGSHYQITQGDRGIHVQKDGNMDYRVEKGKMQFQTGSSDMLMTSGANMNVSAKQQLSVNVGKTIELKVGGSSIKIEDGKITLKSDKIICDGETHCGGDGGQLAGTCGGGCASKTYVN